MNENPYNVGPSYIVTSLCERLKWTDETILKLPYLRVGMHMRNLEIMGKMEKDHADGEKIKQEQKNRQQDMVKGMR